MIRSEIIKSIKDLNLSVNDYVIISGASMVLQGIKDQTNDVDIAVTEKLYNELLNKYDCQFERNFLGNKVWYINNCINFSTNFYKMSKKDCIYVNEMPCQNISSIIELKKQLNREKDKIDLKLLQNFIIKNNKNSRQ